MAFTTDDRVAILDLMARFCHTYADRDGDGWAALFTEDGEFNGRRASQACP